MKNWEPALGGAFTALGMGLYVVASQQTVTSDTIETLWWIKLIAGIMASFGAFFTALFSASARNVATITATVNDNTRALISGDATQLVLPKPQTIGEAAANIAAKQAGENKP